MRSALPLVLLLALTACGTPTRWEKAGISEDTKEDDLSICRRAAARKGLAYYPSAVNAPPGWAYQQPWAIMDTYSDDFRYHADYQLTDACMRYKGYDKVPVSN
jgi:hypothetical protein